MSPRSANFQLEFFLPRDHFKRDEAHEIFSIEDFIFIFMIWGNKIIAANGATGKNYVIENLLF
jgi:hypothetical protein